MMVRVWALAACAALLAGVTGCNDKELAAVPGELTASPSEIDYGLVKEQTQFAQTVIVSNKGSRTARIIGLALDPPDAPFVILGDVPTPEAPLAIEGGSFRPIEVAFAPTATGIVEGPRFVILHENGDLEVGLKGHGYHTTLDDFEQGGTIGGLADILFIVDNSGSMSDKQIKLGNSFHTFINWLIGGEVDYRIAITTTDMADPGHQGQFRASGSNPKVLDTSTPNIIDTFKQNANVGDTGSGDEQGLIAAAQALSPTLLAGPNAGFLRSEAKLYVVWVTDENDSSPSNPGTYQSQIVAAKGGDASKVFFAAIAGPEPLGCFTFADSADAGTRYLDIIDATSGLFGSICDTDFGVTLQDLAFQVTSGGGTFPLSEIPDVTSIQVLVDGIPQATTTWVYSASMNAIQFVPGFEPAGGADVTVSYDVL